MRITSAPPMPPDQIAAAIHAVRGIDRRMADDATRRLIVAFGPYVTRSHRDRSVIDPDELDCIAAESLWVAAKTFDLQHRDPARFGIFAWIVTKRAVVNHLRRNSGRSLGWPSDAIHELPDDQNILADLCRSEMMGEVLAVLSPFEANVIRHRAEGMAPRQVAECLGRTAKDIDNAYQRARVKLMEHFGRDGEGLLAA